MRVAVYGSRPDGHARVVVEVLTRDSELDLVGLIDDYPDNADRRVGELAVIGSRADLPDLARDGLEGIVLGFGAAKGRAEILAAVEALGLAMPSLVHPSAQVAASAAIGLGTQVLPGVIIGPGSRIGRGTLINSGAIVEHDGDIRDCAVIDPGAVLAGRVSVGEAAEIGSGAVLLPDVVIGALAVVGAGSVVTGPVAEGETVAGVPARQLRP